MAKNQKTPITYREVLLARYQGFCDAIAAIFFPYAEVVVHDLGTQSVVYIANNISKRMLGDASALDNIEFDSDENVLGPFEKLNWDGRAVRSVSIVVRDDEQQAIGVICLNLNIAVFEHERLLIYVSKVQRLCPNLTSCSKTIGRSASTPICTIGCNRINWVCPRSAVSISVNWCTCCMSRVPSMVKVPPTMSPMCSTWDVPRCLNI